jgi:voltage-gated potassium channel
MPWRETMTGITQFGRARRWLFDTIEGGGTLRRARIFDQCMVGLIIVNVAAVILESVPSIYAQYGVWFDIFDDISISIFAVEYAFRMWVSVELIYVRQRGPVWGRAMFALRPSMIIDLLAITPPLLELLVPDADLRVLRIFRLMRFLKLARFSPAMTTLSQALYSERRALIGAFILMVGTAVFAGAVMHLIEGDAQPDKFGSIPEGMWWALATLTTIGYGDVVPVTPLGKMFGSVIMICGLALFSLPIGIIATAFVNEIHRRDFVVTWGMVARVPLFSNLDAAAIAEVMKIMRTRVVAAGTKVMHQGEEAEGMYFISDGEMRVDLPSRAIILKSGEFFGEIALLKKVKRLASATAVTRCHLMVIDALDFENLMQNDAGLRERITEAVDQRVSGDWSDMVSDLTEEEMLARTSEAAQGT